jgi:DNA gyrase subunit B
MGTNIGDMFDLEKLRYHKIVIMTDADVDGSHIRTLLLTLFFRYFPDLITGGFLYIAQPPLYSTKEGKNMHWMYTEEDLASYKIEKGYVDEVDLVEIETDADGEEEEENEEATSKKKKKLAIQRYKGLGEMNPEQLWHTTMNPETRMLKQVTIEDAEKANEIFDVLMGSEVAPRKKFIQTHAKYVTNLDV